MRITKTKTILLTAFLFLYFVHTPLGRLLWAVLLGFMLASQVFEEGDEVIALSPAFGLSYVVLASYIVSALGISLEHLSTISLVAGIFLVFFGRYGFKAGHDRKTALALLIAVLMEFAVKRFYFLLPDYRAADTWFHASKVRMILDTGTLYFNEVPSYFSALIKTYPSGYHALVNWLSAGDPGNIIFAMNHLRLFEWAWFPIATYLAVKILAGKDAALYAAIVTPFSALYYYFVQYALLPAFTNYLLFLFAVFLYVRAMENTDAKHILAATAVSTVMLLVHPYQYMAFQAFAGFCLLAEKNNKKALQVFMVQLLLSAGFYYAFTPSATSYVRNGIKTNSVYLNKDNVEFLMSILKFTFLGNGQLLLGIGFVIGMVASAVKRNRLLPLVATVFFLFSLILDKIYWRVPVPYYSAIWNSERVFILLTPVIPIFEGAGLYCIVSFVLSRFKSILTPIFRFMVITGLVLLFVAPAVHPLSIEHMASESSYLLDTKTITALREVSHIVDSNIVATACVFDSGRWLPILTDTPIECLANNNGINYDAYFRLFKEGIPGYVYVDSRGAAEIDPYPLNVEEFYGRYRLLYFNSGIWLFDTSMPSSAEDISRIRDYFLANGSIDCSKRGSERYFVYGWVLKNYAAQKARINGVPYIVTLSRNSTIAFVPDRNYSTIHVLLSLPARKTVRFYINGAPVGSFDSEGDYFPTWVALKANLTSGELNFLTIDVKLNPGEAMGVGYVKFEEGENT